MQGGSDPFFGFGDPFGSFGGPFGSFGGFGGRRSLMSSFFGGRDPFDDPFFTRPFGSMPEWSIFPPIGSAFMGAHVSGFIENQPSQPNRSKGPVIEELNSEDDTDEKETKTDKNDNPRKHGRSSVEDPDDVAAERKSKQMVRRTDLKQIQHMRSQPHVQSFTFQSSSVTYGGTDGAFYISSKTRGGSDGLTFEEHKEANSTTGQAAHRISRGIRNKGHSLTRKLNSDGRLYTMQTLHNLNEDEVNGFEEAWKGKAQKHVPGWNARFDAREVTASGSGSSSQHGSSNGLALRSTDMSNRVGVMKPGIGHAWPQQSSRVKADISDKVGSLHTRSRHVGTSIVDDIKRH